MFVSLLLDDEMTPRDAWDILGNAIVNERKEVECKPIIDWMKVALTREGVGQQSRLAQQSLTAPLSNRVLMEHQWKLMIQDLPALDPAAMRGRKDRIADELGVLVGMQKDVLDDRKAERAKRENKFPSEVFGSQIENVMRLCRVAREQDLPGVWLELARTPVKQHRTVIQKWVDQTANDIADGISIIVTPTLVKKITTLEFVMRNKQSLESGVHPFTFNQHHAAEREQAAEVASLYDFVNGGQVRTGLADAQVLLANDTIGFPQLTSHGRGMIKRCMVWYATFLGNAQPLVDQHQEFIDTWMLNEAEYEVMVPTDRSMATFVPTMFCRWFQLRLTDYINRQWRSSVNIAIPDFQDLFRRIEVGDPWEVKLPLQYDRMLQGGVNDAGGNERGGGLVAEGGGGVVGVGDDDGGGNRNGGGPNNTICRNLNYRQQLFQRFAVLVCRVRDIVTAAPVPPPMSPHDNTCQMCVSYHVKGMCNDRCGRSVDHAAHTPAQDNLLLEWCTAHYVLP